MGCGWSNPSNVNSVYMFRKRSSTYSNNKYQKIHAYKYHHIGRDISSVNTIGPRRTSNVKVSKRQTF